MKGLNNLDLLQEKLEQNPNIKLYGNYKFRLGMFYGYLLGSFLMALFWGVIL